MRLAHNGFYLSELLKLIALNCLAAKILIKSTRLNGKSKKNVSRSVPLKRHLQLAFTPHLAKIMLAAAIIILGQKSLYNSILRLACPNCL